MPKCSASRKEGIRHMDFVYQKELTVSNRVLMNEDFL